MVHKLYESQCHFFDLYQVKDTKDQDYLERFNTTGAVLEKIVSTMVERNSAIINATLKNHADRTKPDVVCKV